MNQITAVLSAPSNESGSEDVKSALIELIKLARTGEREHVPQVKSLMPIITETLKHSEVLLHFDLYDCCFMFFFISFSMLAIGI